MKELFCFQALRSMFNATTCFSRGWMLSISSHLPEGHSHQLGDDKLSALTLNRQRNGFGPVFALAAFQKTAVNVSNKYSELARRGTLRTRPRLLIRRLWNMAQPEPGPIFVSV